MKNLLTAFILLSFFSLTQISCSSSVDNRITFKNMSAGKILVNFRGSEISVSSQKETTIKEIPKGRYTYATTYTVPFGTTSSSAVGDVSGEVTIKAGTKILIIYSSTFVEGVYTIYATMSNSDDLDADDSGTNP